jgi:hypothetical protein
MELGEIRFQLINMGVDPILLDYINKMTNEEQEGLFQLFIQIVEDELLFCLALKDLNLSDEYLLQREQYLPLIAN